MEAYGGLDAILKADTIQLICHHNNHIGLVSAHIPTAEVIIYETALDGTDDNTNTVDMARRMAGLLGKCGVVFRIVNAVLLEILPTLIYK